MHFSLLVIQSYNKILQKKFQIKSLSLSIIEVLRDQLKLIWIFFSSISHFFTITFLMSWFFSQVKNNLLLPSYIKDLSVVCIEPINNFISVKKQDDKYWTDAPVTKKLITVDFWTFEHSCNFRLHLLFSLSPLYNATAVNVVVFLRLSRMQPPC